MRASRRHSLGLLHLTTQFDQCLAAHFGANLGEELTLLFAHMVSHILGEDGHLGWESLVRRIHIHQFREEPFDDVVLFKGFEHVTFRIWYRTADGRIKDLLFHGCMLGQ